MSITPATCPALRPRGHAALAAAWSRPRGPSHLSYSQFCSQSIFSGRVLAKHQPALDVYASKSSVLHAISLQPPRRNHFKPSKRKTNPNKSAVALYGFVSVLMGSSFLSPFPQASFQAPAPRGSCAWPHEAEHCAVGLCLHTAAGGCPPARLGAECCRWGPRWGCPGPWGPVDALSTLCRFAA